jgi:hypothetical protein
MTGLDFAEETPLRREPLCNQPFPGGGEAGDQRFPATTVGVSAGGSGTPSSQINLRVTWRSLPAPDRAN